MTSSPAPGGNNLRRQAFLRQASTPAIGSKKPPLIPRWLHALETGKGWTTFGLRDSGNLEHSWKAFQNSDEAKAPNTDAGKQGPESTATEAGPSATPGEKEQERREKGKDIAPESKEAESLLEAPDPDTPLPVWRVPVAEDRLFEVDLRTFKLWPVFWKGKGCEVLRGSWFFDSSKISPCNDEVARELEDLYHSIKPWLPSYADELRSAVALGAEAEQKLRAPMASLKGSYVIFLGPYLARIYQDDVTSRMTKTLWTAWSGTHSGGTLVARGFDNARRLLRTRETKWPSTTGKSARMGGHTAKDSGDFRGSPKPPSKMPKTDIPAKPTDTDSPELDGAAKPTVENSGLDEEELEPAIITAAASTEVGAADMLRSLATKFGSWGTASSQRASQVSALTRNDIKDAFKEAQNRIQGNESEDLAEKLKGITSTGLNNEKEYSSEREEHDLTAEEEAREEREELQREQEREESPQELVLVIHGIGQVSDGDVDPLQAGT
jgi:hypothetical protein